MSASQVHLFATIRCQFTASAQEQQTHRVSVEGASVEPCAVGGFLLADLFEAGVGDGLLIAAVVVVVPVVPDCSHDARNAMPINMVIKESKCPS